MKRILLLFSVIFCLQLNAQTITGIVLVPSAPDDNDTLTFYIGMEFPYMNCDGSAMGSVAGNTIYGYGHHCMGMLTTICNDFDTIIVPPQPAGSYSFIFTLDAGFGGPPCSPPFAPNDYDTLDFTISSTVGLTERAKPSLNVFPNPTQGSFSIVIDGLQQSQTIEVRNQLGEMVLSKPYQQGLQMQLPAGIYLVYLPGLNLFERLVVVK